MTYEEANSVKHLASDVMKVLEKLEIECKKCKGKGSFWKNGKALSDERAEVLPKIRCKKCKGTGKVKYSWTPKVGEFCIYKKNNIISLVVKHWPKNETNKYDSVEVIFPHSDKYGIEEFMDEFIPILHWEEIEGVLERVGYEVETYQHREWGQRLKQAVADIWSKNRKAMSETIFGYGKSRQEAVMLAIIELGKKLSNGKE